MKQDIVITWFKRDLRITDHVALFTASKSKKPVLPLYIVEPDYWQQPFASRRQWSFIYDCLKELREDLKNIGMPLVARTGETIDIFNQLREDYNITDIFAHEETGNDWTYTRDKKVITWCKQHNINLHEFPSNGVVRRLKNRDDWTKIRNKRMFENLITTPKRLKKIQKIELGDIPSKDDKLFGAPLLGDVQQGGRIAALKTLNSFLQQRGHKYMAHISSPLMSDTYCSRLSPHLTWGSLSVREAIKATQTRRQELDKDDQKYWRQNLNAFGSRLSWRCHFIQKIEDQPSIEYRCMHPAFEDMRDTEDFNKEYLDAWMTGQTGYPLIDACMRCLNHTGWITFRMRAMLVSFASYHLWLDWRITGHHLARVFTDYEPGIHYSQLQMQSGVTGINTLRIYNPIKQSQDQDPNGTFIRKWVPELKNVSDAWIHEPWKMDDKLQEHFKCIIGKDYPAPIVDHKQAVADARDKISEVRRKAGFKEDAGKVYQKLGSRKRPPSKRNALRGNEKRDEHTSEQLSLPL